MFKQSVTGLLLCGSLLSLLLRSFLTAYNVIDYTDIAASKALLRHVDPRNERVTADGGSPRFPLRSNNLTNSTARGMNFTTPKEYGANSTRRFPLRSNNLTNSTARGMNFTTPREYGANSTRRFSLRSNNLTNSTARGANSTRRFPLRSNNLTKSTARGMNFTTPKEYGANSTKPKQRVFGPRKGPITACGGSPCSFSHPDNLMNNMARGMNFITPFSGCRLARWVFGNNKHDCKTMPKSKLLSVASPIKENDTIYVTYQVLDKFVENHAPKINVSYVLIAGSNDIYPTRHEFYRKSAALAANLPQVVAYFTHNVETYVSPDQQRNPKIKPFPYGMREARPGDKDPRLPAYEDAFLRNLFTEKKEAIFVGYFATAGLRSNRIGLPIGKKLSPRVYYNKMARSRYVLSPNGDRPDCYRHYEAIGLGTIPITQMNEHNYRHLKDGPVIYNNTNWNLAELTNALPLNVSANRNMVFEEYWMEYVELNAGGRALNWWDRKTQRPTTLLELVPSAAEIAAFRKAHGLKQLMA